MITAANGQTIRVLVSEIRAGRGRGHSVQLLFEAEASVAIDRQEIYDQKQAAKKAG
jgi:sRNA-binding carbon storage regulator CsrA